MAAYREYATRDRVTGPGGGGRAKPVALITVYFDNGAVGVYDPKDSLFPELGDTVKTLKGEVLTVKFSEHGGAAAQAGLEKDVGGRTPRDRA